MAIGTIWAPEIQEFADPTSGARVRRLTRHKAHSHHLYFTNPGWHDAGRRLIVASDRGNASNLYSLELASGLITQITDANEAADGEIAAQYACVNPTREELYYWQGRTLWAVDLTTQASRALWECPDGLEGGILNCTADGMSVCCMVGENPNDLLPDDVKRGMTHLHIIWEAHPLSRIMCIATDGGGAEIVWEERNAIGHVNTSPTQPHLISFCHEGPWGEVDNRIWGFNLRTREAWHIRQCGEGEVVGHEFWYADGLHIGYHGFLEHGAKKVIGRVRYDNTGLVEPAFPHRTGHTHSNDGSLVAGDAGQVRLWRWNGEGYDGPRVLCEHRCSAHVQALHVHPRFSPDGTQVLFTSDMGGYGNVYLVDIPPFESLPAAKE
jgi:oligogalacturonide lyase